MGEIGQPMHAFDAALVAGPIQIRYAKKGEEIKTIDGQDVLLSAADLVIADDKGPLAIAGVKGGKRAEINPYTQKIIVESASFEPTGIYKTSRAVNLITDASSRFSHGLSPALTEVALNRAAELLKEICKAKMGEWTDVVVTAQPKLVLKFDTAEFNRLTGLALKDAEAFDYLKRLGFGVKGRLVEVPATRTDIAIHADLVEEIINLYGYENLPDAAPIVPILPAKEEDRVIIKDKIRNTLQSFGMSEVYNYSFVSRKDLTKYADPKWWGAVPLRNPISSDYQYLRPDLFVEMARNLEDNFRYYNAVRIFEIGKIFIDLNGRLEERMNLGMAIGFKKPAFAGEAFLEIKGATDQLMRDLGIVDYFFKEEKKEMKIFEPGHGSISVEDGNNRVIGRIGIVRDNPTCAFSYLKLDRILKLAMEEKEYEPLPKYPTIMRDLSLLVPNDVRVNELMESMENAAPDYLDDVDLLDYYQDEKLKEGSKSLTFRLIFFADDRTLTDKEVGAEMEKVINALHGKFDLE